MSGAFIKIGAPALALHHLVLIPVPFGTSIPKAGLGIPCGLLTVLRLQ